MALDPALVDRALQEATKRAENLDYFFENLNSPNWIEPLAVRGFFSEPPPQLVDEQGYVRAPGWSASRYLARVAAADPAAVFNVIRGIDSNNERVHEDFEDAALAMPAEFARQVALLEAAWIATCDHIYYLLPTKTVALIDRLASDGETDAAFELFRVLFAPLPDTRESEWVLRHPQSRFSDWEYDRLLKEVVSKVAPSAPVELVIALAALLDDAMSLMMEEEDKQPLPDRLWRTRVASDQHRAMNVEDALVSALRDVVVLIRERGLISDEDLVTLLASREGEIYGRIVMHALARPPRVALEIVQPFVMDLDELADPEPSVEFRELLRSQATRLEPDQLSELLAAIDQGPDVDRYRELAEKYGGRAPTEEDVRRHVARWQVGRLRLLEEALPPEWAARRAELASEVGDEEIGVSGEVSTFVGPTSPLTVEQLEEMDDEDLVAYLERWTPDQRWDAPSVEGLARGFSAFAEQNPVRASSIINRLRDARPAYIQWALHGLEQAVRRGETLSWAAVLDLMEWIADQPRERPGGRGDDYDDLDPGWVWTRRAVVSLLEAGLSARDDARIAFSERQRVWHIISLIAADPDPTPEDEEGFGGSNMDPATLALNTTRPRALRAAIAYAVWVFHESYPTSEERERAGGQFFAEAPEVAELLAAHLDPHVDPSEAVRGAIGQHFANLFALDHGWAQEIADVLFPRVDSRLREAAWGAFVIYNAPYNNILAAIRPQYVRSAELAGSTGHGFRWMNGDPRAKLGEHVATFYWRGVIDLADELLTTYWSTATQEAKAHVVEFLGRSARELPEIDEAVVARLKEFWNMVHASASDSTDRLELAGFAWWFAARALPREWRVQQLAALLESGVKPVPAFLVAEELPEVAREDPLRVIQLLRRLLELESEGWAIDAWREQIENVLETALSSPSDDARRIAEETANWLGALGYRNFRRLTA